MSSLPAAISNIFAGAPFRLKNICRNGALAAFRHHYTPSSGAGPTSAEVSALQFHWLTEKKDHKWIFLQNYPLFFIIITSSMWTKHYKNTISGWIVCTLTALRLHNDITQQPVTWHRLSSFSPYFWLTWQALLWNVSKEQNMLLVALQFCGKINSRKSYLCRFSH